MFPSKKSRRLAKIAGATVGALVLAWRPAAADDIDLQLKVDVGGLTVMKVKLGFTLSEGGFGTEAVIRSEGLAALWGEYKMSAEGSGLNGADGIRPRAYSFRRDKDGKKKSRQLSWGEDGMLRQHQAASNDADVQAGIDAALTASTFDPLSAILRLGLNSGKTPCGTTYRVFDGRDVFDVALGPRENAMLDGDSDTAYEGPAHFCDFKWVAIAGRWFSKSKPSELVDDYDVWFAPVPVSGQKVWLPMLITGKLKGLKFKAYAARITVNGEKYSGP